MSESKVESMSPSPPNKQGLKRLADADDDKVVDADGGDKVVDADGGDKVVDADGDDKVVDADGDKVVDGDEEGWIGPMPEDAEQPKKRKKLEYEQVYCGRLPLVDGYEKSYMHRDVITHIVATPTDFIVTASSDGHVKFWKKQEVGIEFVKHFRAHMSAIQHMAANIDGSLLATISLDKGVKVFDVINFDMINILKLDIRPRVCEWIHTSGEASNTLAVADYDSSKMYIYDGRGGSENLKVLDRLHFQPVICISYNPIYEVVVSVDKGGMLEYWQSAKNDYKFPEKIVNFEYKMDTDLFEIAKKKTYTSSLAFSPSGKHFATLCRDRKVRVFNFLTGKMTLLIDDSLQHYIETQHNTSLLNNMEFGKKMSVERELEHSESFDLANITYDESGYFILYPTLAGIKVVNLYSKTCVKLIGKSENARFLHMALLQGKYRRSGTSSRLTVEMEAADNPSLQKDTSDPSLFCTGFKKNRFYIFSTRNPDDTSSGGDRDVFNEKPTKEDIIAATDTGGSKRISDGCVIHTNMGDIHCKLFPKECPKSVENFCVHSRNGYFNGHIFHRIIKSFMIQTGDPTGKGSGGESIWGGEFEDEFHPILKHDRPYTMSMANAGPNTNGSQFFITVIPCPWLDNKHTVFGRVIRGMEVVQNISVVRTNPKTDKPYDDVRVISITLK